MVARNEIIYIYTLYYLVPDDFFVQPLDGLKFSTFNTFCVPENVILRESHFEGGGGPQGH